MVYSVLVRSLAMITFLSASVSCGSSNEDPSVRIVSLEGGKVSDAVFDKVGVLHVAYFLAKNVYYMYSLDDGETFSAPIQVNSETGFAAGGLFRGPDLDVSPEGEVHIVWYNDAYRQKRPQNEWGVMYSRINDDKLGFETTRNINHIPSDSYALAVGDSGAVSILWVAEKLFRATSSNGGQTFSDPEILTDEPCECCATHGLYAPDKRFYYLYRDKQNDDRDMYLGTTGSRIRLHEKSWHITACPISGSSLTEAANNLDVAWESQGLIFAASYALGEREYNGRERLVSESGKYPVVLRNSKEYLFAWKKGKSLEWRKLNTSTDQLSDVKSISSPNGDRFAGVVSAAGTFILFN